jgi:hypothetical protein
MSTDLGRMPGVDFCREAVRDGQPAPLTWEHVRDCRVCLRRAYMLEAELKGWEPIACEEALDLFAPMAKALAARRAPAEDEVARGFYAHLAECQQCESDFAIDVAAAWPAPVSWVPVQKPVSSLAQVTQRLVRMLPKRAPAVAALQAASRGWRELAALGAADADTGMIRVLANDNGEIALELTAPASPSADAAWQIDFPAATGGAADGVDWWRDPRHMSIPIPTSRRTRLLPIGRLLDHGPATHAEAARICASIEAEIDAPAEGPST